MTEFKNPAATADIIFEKDWKILLVKRKYDPFKGMWAIPGGFIEYGKETLEQTAIREAKEETGLDISELELVGIYSSPNRDPRGHNISHVYLAKKYKGKVKAGDDSKEVAYFSFDDLPELAFDHEKILKDYFSWRNRK